jgi:hypothetical protein
MGRRVARITFRLSAEELAAIKAFADERHCISSRAIRWLLAMGLKTTVAPSKTGEKARAVSPLGSS